jgi:serine O-acetyltransferase
MINRDLSCVLDISEVVQQLARVRQKWRSKQQRNIEAKTRELPSRDALSEILEGLRGALFPMRLGPADLRQPGEDYYVGHTLHEVLQALLLQVRLEIAYIHRHEDLDLLDTTQIANRIVSEFARSLPHIRELLDSDVIAAFAGDPAASSVDEVLLCYPGIDAMIYHRVAHELFQLGTPLISRLVAELAHARTGIDIHPGAKIGAGCFIDHGTGVVIGETAVIGQRVRIYQAVTLGAKSFPVNDQGQIVKGLPRHPVVEDDVVIYAGATVLGRVTVGRGASIGGNVWVTHDVPAGAKLTQARSQSEELRVQT